MSAAPEHHRPASLFAQWSLIGVAVLLIYFISIPWIEVLTAPHPRLYRANLVYQAPWKWVFSNTPLRDTLFNYYIWVLEFTDPHRNLKSSAATHSPSS